jgi:nitroimidazol reductase NimA-like FMN-containing flavoprotein (pyridoxamine 5'-phosphate oxidase superfamily)
MHPVKRLMPDDDARAFLRSQKVAHAATLDATGWPYVVLLIFVSEGGDQLYVHTGNHGGHFQRNIESHPRVCIEVADMGPVHRGQLRNDLLRRRDNRCGLVGVVP